MTMRLLTWLTLFLLCPILASAAEPEQKPGALALVIGNADYPGPKGGLASTVNDARAVAEELRRLHFDVDLQENLGKEKMQLAIASFVSKIAKGTTALFYFSGIGLQSVRQTYLLPTDAQIRTEEDVWRDGISVDAMLSEMNRIGAKTKIIIIDAARKNAFESRFRASPAGLAPLVAPIGTLALYSASPGKLIDNATTKNSLFTTELIKQLRTGGITAETAFNRTRIGVSHASNNEQVPFVVSSLSEEFYLASSRSLVTNPPAISEPTRLAPPQTTHEPPRPRQQPTQQAAREPARQPVHAGPGKVLRDCTDCPDLVVVPTGSFDMGSPTSDYDKPIHRVSIGKPFAIGLFEVTFKEWDRCVEDRGCKTRPDDRGWGRGNHPVINVSWLDAKQYVEWLTKKTGHVYRLPSEAEWEYAARAGTTSPFWWGRNVGAREANCLECKTGKGEQSLPVGSYKPNAFGLFDTAGNVAEWVEDCWHDDYKGAPGDGSAWGASGTCQLRVLRGGSFDSQALYVQSGVRFRYDYDVPYSANGFRVVRELN
jgi:formylglycine-generating enzyme required for sulfatase activity